MNTQRPQKKNPCARNSNTHVHTRKLTHTQKNWYRHQHWTLHKNRHRHRYIDTHNTRTHTHMYKYTHTFVHYLTSVMQSKCWSQQHMASYQRSMCNCNLRGAGSAIPANTTHVHNHSDACSKLVAEHDGTSSIWRAASYLKRSAYHSCQLFPARNWNRRHANWHAFTVDASYVSTLGYSLRSAAIISWEWFASRHRSLSTLLHARAVAAMTSTCWMLAQWASLVGCFQTDLPSSDFAPKCKFRAKVHEHYGGRALSKPCQV